MTSSPPFAHLSLLPSHARSSIFSLSISIHPAIANVRISVILYLFLFFVFFLLLSFVILSEILVPGTCIIRWEWMYNAWSFDWGHHQACRRIIMCISQTLKRSHLTGKQDYAWGLKNPSLNLLNFDGILSVFSNFLFDYYRTFSDTIYAYRTPSVQPG